MDGTMAYDHELRDRLLDALASLGEVHGRAMFGGHGLFERGAIFGLLMDATAYFKVDDESKPRYLEAESQPFNPPNDPVGTLFYYAVPGEVLDDPARLDAWAREAIRVGHATLRPKRTRKRGA
jgi:DNA transformation protein and related proteins